MNISDAGLHLIAQFEGYAPVPAPDPVGYCTVGYGHLIAERSCTRADTKAYAGWTSAQFLQLLRKDAATAQDAVNSSVHVRLGILPGRAQARFDALCSLAYNIGTGAFASSSLVRAINAKGAPRNWSTVGPYWLEWDHAGGAVLQGLLNRRREEFAIFQAGKYPT